MTEKTWDTLGSYALLLENARMMTEFYSNGLEDLLVQGLTYDSRLVEEGTLFICKGAAFKAEYLDAAIEKGAVAYVSEKKYDTKEDVPYILVEDIRKAMPPLAEKFFRTPWKELIITGIGGTKGKSTSAYYMKAIVDDYMAAEGGKESAVISSIDIYDGVIKKSPTLPRRRPWNFRSICAMPRTAGSAMWRWRCPPRR